MVGGIKPTDVLTHEQMGVVNHSIRDGEVLKVVALAGKQWLLHYCIVSAAKICSDKYLDTGTGKTTTLVKFSETFLKNSKNPDAKLLYCVFNRYVNYLLLHEPCLLLFFLSIKICYGVCQEAISKSCRCTHISFTGICGIGYEVSCIACFDC